jgi:hypothetical protein
MYFYRFTITLTVTVTVNRTEQSIALHGLIAHE